MKCKLCDWTRILAHKVGLIREPIQWVYRGGGSAGENSLFVPYHRPYDPEDGKWT